MKNTITETKTALYDALLKLYDLYDEYNINETDANRLYPFHKSLEEIISDTATFFDALDDEINA